jgi:UDP-glucose 4-epimerase
MSSGIDVPHEFGPRRSGDAVALVSGSLRAGDDLGWSAGRSTLDLMTADAWRW